METIKALNHWFKEVGHFAYKDASDRQHLKPYDQVVLGDYTVVEVICYYHNPPKVAMLVGVSVTGSNGYVKGWEYYIIDYLSGSVGPGIRIADSRINDKRLAVENFNRTIETFL